MGLFWNRHKDCDARIRELESRCEKLEISLRRVRDESSELAERAYRNLKKAEARSRRELDATESGTGTAPATPGAPTPARTPLRLRGVLARRLARAQARDPLDELDESANGSE